MMKINALLILLPVAVACCNRHEGMVLRGTVPGAMDSTEVRLRFEHPDMETLKGYVIGGKFELAGQLPYGACYASLSLNNEAVAERRGLKGKGIVQYREAHFFVENGKLTFTVPHIDSLPHAF